MATDYFGVLGLSRGAGDNDIKRAYRRLARDLHPDVNPDPEAKERFQEVTRAYEALGGLGVVGPTRMDYAGNMAAVRAVARYVGHLLAES